MLELSQPATVKAEADRKEAEPLGARQEWDRKGKRVSQLGK